MEYGLAVLGLAGRAQWYWGEGRQVCGMDEASTCIASQEAEGWPS